MNNSSDWLFKYLDLLQKNRQFLSTHGVIKKFPEVNKLLYICEIDKVKISTITQNNLNEVSKLLDVQWLYCIPYFATINTNRKGYFFYGLLKNNELINFHRKETCSPGAGQTIMQIGNSTLQISKLLKILNNERVRLDNRDIKSLFKLNEIIDLNHNIQKKLFENL